MMDTRLQEYLPPEQLLLSIFIVCASLCIGKYSSPVRQGLPQSRGKQDGHRRDTDVCLCVCVCVCVVRVCEGDEHLH